MDLSPLNISLSDTESGHEILDKIFKYSHDGILVIDLNEETIILANPGMADMLGYSDNDLNGLPVKNIYSAEMDELRKFIGTIEAGSGWTDQLSCLTQHGEMLDTETAASFITYNHRKCLLAIVRDITDKKTLENGLREALEDIKKLSLEDELTKLNNRRGLYALGEQQLKVARRMNTDVTVFFGDLDNLKVINDTFGHAAGDQAIIMVADVLRTCFRETDILARIGGDEFVVISFGCNLDVTRTLVERIQSELDSVGEVVDLPYPVHISFGAACQDLDGTFDLDLLIKLADDRMYKIKSKRKELETQ